MHDKPAYAALRHVASLQLASRQIRGLEPVNRRKTFVK
jgi:hypothetical protein